jgi:ABC transporter substrate binding protein (PQQ-dependent alcohol dehydrogenase system)
MRSSSMTDRPSRLAQSISAAVVRMLLMLCCIANAPAARAQTTNTLTIGYVEIDGDARYTPMYGAERMILATRDRPFPAVQVALDEAKPLSQFVHRDFAVARITVKSMGDVAPAVLDALQTRDIHFFVLDLPADAVKLLASAIRGKNVLLLNATAQDDWLRRDTCSAEIVHTIPSLAMTTDALVQYLVFRKWRDVLLLQGPRPGDAVLADAFARSVKKFGAHITGRVPFKLGNDPREREQNDIGLLTATSRDYDAVFVADTDPDLEFARFVPYRTTRPRLVLGSVGLVADAWHWTWDRYGAPQLINRFLAKAGRHMTGLDWAVWMATKLVTAAALRTRSGDFGKMTAQILSDTSYDGVKGLAVSVRPWDHQLRQAILLSTGDAVIASAPLPGFLHATNELDTLGDDQPETPCHLGGS